jgi:hypothetical protein
MGRIDVLTRQDSLLTVDARAVFLRRTLKHQTVEIWSDDRQIGNLERLNYHGDSSSSLKYGCLAAPFGFQWIIKRD